MAVISIHPPWAFIFGILGNIVSFMVYLAPVPTFYRVFKKKSTEGFHSVPYVAALFSAMLWIYYAALKSNAILIITINSFGCVIETIYIAIYITYAPKKARIQTLKLLLFFNFGGFSLISILTQTLTKGSNRAQVLGWINLVFSLSVFVAPLSILKQVIRTKSVQFMPFSLSFSLSLSAIAWFFYGLLQKDFYIAIPNILGFLFGVLQMILYVIYKNCNKLEEEKLATAITPNTVKNSEVHPVCTLPNFRQSKEVNPQNDEHDDQREAEEKHVDPSNQV